MTKPSVTITMEGVQVVPSAPEKAITAMPDDDIAKRVGLITRLVKTRITNRDELQREIEDLIREKSNLVAEQSARLRKQLDEIRAQLPAQPVDAPKDGEQ